MSHLANTRYRCRPIEIDAIHFDGTAASVIAVMHFIDAGSSVNEIRIHIDETPGMSYMELPGPEGLLNVDAGDWVIRDRRGRLGRCGDDVFNATYEPVPDRATVPLDEP